MQKSSLMKDAEAVDNLLRAAWYGALCRAVDQLRSENPSLGTAAVAESGDASMAGALRSKRDAGMRKLQSKHEAEMKSIRSTQEAEMKTLQSSHEAEMRTLQSRNDALDAEVQELRRLCTDQRAELEVSQEDIQHYKVVARKLQGMVDAMMTKNGNLIAAVAAPPAYDYKERDPEFAQQVEDMMMNMRRPT